MLQKLMQEKMLPKNLWKKFKKLKWKLKKKKNKKKKKKQNNNKMKKKKKLLQKVKNLKKPLQLKVNPEKFLPKKAYKNLLPQEKKVPVNSPPKNW